MTNHKTHSVLFVGLGGQGVLLASGVTAMVAFRAGMDVKQSEVHGMAQRGGSVTSQVRFGKKVYSALIPQGTADILVAFHNRESVRCRPQLKPDGIVIDPTVNGAENELRNKWGNVYVLGLLSKHLPFDANIWEEVIQTVVPERFLEVNLAAFQRGASSGL